MKLITGAIALTCALSLVGCVGPFASKTCGLDNSLWQSMSADEQVAFAKSYHEKQRLAEQLKINKMSVKHQKKLAKQLKKNEKAQARRLKIERESIMKQQAKIELDMQRQQQAAANPEPVVETVSPVIEIIVDPAQFPEAVAG